jgi:hypothetical protein
LTYDQYQDRKYYVPQRGWAVRDLEDRQTYYVGKSSDFSGSSPYQAALVKSKGRASLAGDPFSYIQSIAHSTILSVEKNRTKQTALRFCTENLPVGKHYDMFDIKGTWLIRTDKKDAEGNWIYQEQTKPPTKTQLQEDDKIISQIKEK